MRKKYRRYRRYSRWHYDITLTDKQELKEHNYFLSQTFPFGIIEGVKG